MPGRRRTPALTRSEKIELAQELFSRGWTNADIARRVPLDPDTVTRYRREYEATIKDQAAANPALLTNVLENTVRALQEGESLRRQAWAELESTDPDSHVVRNQIMSTILKIHHERNQLLGLFGVKQEFLIHVQRVQQQQTALIDWMRANLCTADRESLQAFIRSELMETPILAIPEEATSDDEV